MPKSSPKSLKKYKEYVREKLAELTPFLQKAAMGNFTEKIKISEKEDEFSELFVGLNLMTDDLCMLQKKQKKQETERRKRLAELEKWKELTIGRELKMTELKKIIKKMEDKLEIKSFNEKS